MERIVEILFLIVSLSSLPYESRAEYQDLLAKARCEATCYQRWESEHLASINYSDVWVPPPCLQEKCKQCVTGCDAILTKLSCLGQCKTDLTCHESCQNLTVFIDEITKESIVPMKVSPPNVLCQKRESSTKIIVNLHFDLLPLEGQVVNCPVVFVLQLMDRLRSSDWFDIGTTKRSLVPINLSPFTDYIFRLTAVAPDGILGEPVLSDSFTTYLGMEPLLPPTDVKVRSQELFKNKTRIHLSWNSPIGKPCFYSVNYLPKDINNAYGDFLVVEAGQLLDVQVPGLTYDSDYELVVRSRSDLDFSVESPSTRIELRTQSCLNLSRFDLSLCSPPPPKNVRVNPLEHVVEWDKPTYHDSIRSYRIEILKEMEELKSTDPQLEAEIFTLDGNQNRWEVSGLSESAHYKVAVFAISEGGVSKPTSLELDAPVNGENNSAFPNWAYGVFSGAVGVILIALTVGLALRKFRPKKDEGPVSLISPLKRRILHRCPYRMDFASIKLEGVIGQGTFGVVYRAEVIIQGRKETVAAKMLKEESTCEERRHLLQEIDTLLLLGRHDHVVGLRAYAMAGEGGETLPLLTSEMPHTIALMMEFCGLGDLQTYLIKLRNKGEVEEGSRESGFGTSDSGINSVPAQRNQEFIDEMDKETEMLWKSNRDKLLSYARQITLGMDFLAKNKVIHRDLATRNVLLESEHRVKITDFGLSRDIYETGIYTKMTSGRLPLKWMPLESIERQEFSVKSDVWSFGILLWELVNLGSCPYPGLTNQEVVSLLRSGYRMPQPEHCSKTLYDVMGDSWRSSPKERPSFARLRTRIESILDETDNYLHLESETSV